MTTHTCICSDPPKFMRPLDRPKTVSPDVSAFLSTPDPAELVEEEIIDETPHVPWVPPKPSPPARFANRRKLYDETDPGTDSDSIEDDAPNEDASFGEGIDEDFSAAPTPDSDTVRKLESSELPNESHDPGRAASNRSPDEKTRRRRRGRGRGSKSRGNQQSEGNRETLGSNSESDSAPNSSVAEPPASASAQSKGGTDTTDSTESTGSTPSPEGKENPRRRSRRRGRRRGVPPGGGTE